MGDLYRGRPAVDFPKVWKRMGAISALFLVVATVALFARGLNLGIEFEGGVSWEVDGGDVSTGEVRDALEPLGFGDARIQELGGNLLRIRAEAEATNTEETTTVSEALAAVAGVDVSDVSFSAVGPSWGDEITSSAERALVVFFIVIAVYIWIRLQWQMMAAALVAVGHDILITVGVYALFQFDVTPATVIAFLTILGYSLYDTLIVFDKIKENEAKAAANQKLSYTELVSLSANQVLMRSINTTITSVLPVLTLLIVGRLLLGAVTLQEFALALLIGMLAGTYSSVFVATPMVAVLKERQPEYRELRERLGGQDDEDLQDARAALVRSERAGERPANTGLVSRRAKERAARSKIRSEDEKRHRPVGETNVSTQRTHPPRPRKKKRR
jgi:preprotein translocase subunit SecF